ncbi:MAG TPA: hypothetical protein VGH28_14375 [Polyangiaceae bacterium]|jgi:hypothetical protein
MIRASLCVFSVFCCVVSACATGGVGSGEDGGSIVGKDGGIVIGKDSGGGGNDAGGGGDATKPPQDSGLPPVDSGGNCAKAPPSNVCGVYPQCGCAGQQTCEVDQTALDGSSSCIGAGSGAIGSACTQTQGQCAPGLTCIWNECHAYCGTDGSQCNDPNTNYCVNLTDNNSNPIPNLLICHNDCQLQDASSCGGGSEGCIYFDVDKVDCYPVGPQTTCSAANPQCAPGQVCVFDGISSYMCSKWCRMNGSDCGALTCSAFATPPTVNGVEYGYCQ